jgi:tRNA(Arg) A34 adenosine deaminase TadA
MDKKFMQRAIDIAFLGVDSGKGGPFGAVVVKDGVIVGEGSNEVTSTADPSAHAEVVAIRRACSSLGEFQLDGCELYTTCEPCPMCIGAIYWARPDKVYYGSTKEDAAAIGFDDNFIYNEIDLAMKDRKIPFVQMDRSETISLFEKWQDKNDKIDY